MDAHARRALLWLDEATRSVATHEPTHLDAAYLRLVARVEALPENQDGADKAWLWQRQVACRSHFAVAEPTETWTRSRATPPA